MALAQRMLEVVASIPAGRVMTYGQVAAAAGSASPRLAGWVLSQLSDDDLPWHRVLKADGRLAAAVAARQEQLLRAEGVTVLDGRVRLREYHYRL